MGFRFRKSIKAGPVRINLSKSGVGYSVGGKGFRVTKKARGGIKTTASIPGTGISYSTSSKKSAAKSKSKRRATTSAAKPRSSTASNAPSSNGGCMKGFLGFLLLCLVIGLVANYWKILLAAAVIAAAVFIGIKAYQKKHSTETEPNSTATADSIDPPKSEFEIRRDGLIAQFNTELDSISREDVQLSDPVSRQLLKDLPEYNFSNITKKTRLDSIFPLVVLDVETTGLYPSKCEILEVSAIRFETGMTPVSAFTTLCKPSKPIPVDASAVNHITDDMVEDAPAFAQIAPALTEFIKGCHIAGHNLDFDLRFIHAHGAVIPEGVRFYDTLDLAQLTISKSNIYNYKLDTICNYYGIWRDNAHRSLSDCYATSKVFAHLVCAKTGRQLVAGPEIVSGSDSE